MQWSPRTPRDDVNVSQTHPLSEAATLVGGIGLLLVGLVAVAWALVEVAVRWLPYDLEARLFSDLRPSFAAADPDAPDAARAAERRAALQSLLERLVARWPERPAADALALEAGIVALDEPNAVALPGGAVLVTEGLLAQSASENELAFVLAHEIGHFRQRDHLRGLGRAAFVGLALAAVGIGDASAASFSEPFVALAGRGFDRAQESDADAFALTLVAAEYGHAAGAGDFFRRLPDAEGGLAVRVAGWVSTHPVSAARIEALESLAREHGIPLEGAPTPLAPALAHD